VYYGRLEEILAQNSSALLQNWLRP